MVPRETRGRYGKFTFGNRLPLAADRARAHGVIELRSVDAIVAMQLIA
jgi:hypothetical protein